MVPRLLHQTWATSDLPQETRGWVASWRGLERRLWDDDDCREMVRELYPKYFLAYVDLPRAVMRADLWRYLALHAFGGVYADLDVERTRPIDGLLEHDATVCLEDYALSPAVLYVVPGNALMASEPGHPFWLRLADVVVERVAKTKRKASITSPTHDVLWTSGPYALRHAMHASPWSETPHAEPIERFGVHHRMGSWIGGSA